jgi:hypothetical protein
MALPGLPLARLEPIELRVDGELPAIHPETCPLGEIPIAAGCVSKIEDDRIEVRPPEDDTLWLFTSGGQLDMVRAARGRDAFTVRPLVAGSPVDVNWVMVDRAGVGTMGLLRVFTAPPMPHLVITEVHSNPVGPEPEQEFVEIYNDGLRVADLGGYVIEDIGGETALPSGVVLPPGAFAVVVNEDFDATSEYDPMPAPGTLIVRVDKLGKGGLKNDGEPLRLRHDGEVVSRFPALPKPKSGESVQRTMVNGGDDDADGFVRAMPTPGTAYAASEDEAP